MIWLTYLNLMYNLSCIECFVISEDLLAQGSVWSLEHSARLSNKISNTFYLIVFILSLMDLN